jgi:nucleotide-binding universal stress UspA family protein
VQVKLILCPIDFSEFSTRAYRLALSLAGHYRAKLVALHVVELWRYPYADYAASAGDYASFCRAFHKGGKERLQEFVKNHRQDDVQLDLVVREGSAPDSILLYAREQKIDLTVMGTHGRRGFDRLMLGSATDRVMREACCPVLAVCQPSHESSAGGEKGGRGQHFSRILICTDFSENSELALDYAVSLTAEYDAELTVFHVMDKDRNPVRKEDEVMATVAEHLDKLIPAEKRKTLKIRTVIRSGKPYQRIIEYAQEASTDLITMGVRGAGALDRAVFGSTTYRVIQLGPCPVLAVHV